MSENVDLNCFTKEGNKLFRSDTRYDDIRGTCYGILHMFFDGLVQDIFLNGEIEHLPDEVYLMLGEEAKFSYESMKKLTNIINNIVSDDYQFKIFKIAIEICNRRYINDYKIEILKDDDKYSISIVKL